MRTQIIVGMVIIVLNLIALVILPSQYHLAISVFGLGCALMSMSFALMISVMENPKPRYRRNGGQF